MDTNLNVMDYDIPLIKLKLMPDRLDIMENKQKTSQVTEQTDFDYAISQKLEQLKCFLERHYEEDCVVLMDIDSPLLTKKEQQALLNGIYRALEYDAKILIGNACWVDQILPVSDTLVWIDHFNHSSLIVFYKSVFDAIINCVACESESFIGHLSYISSQKFLLSPFIPTKKCSHYYGYDAIQKKINMIVDIQNYYGFRLNSKYDTK